MTATPCAFCAIVAGDARAHLVYEDETVVGFLDRSPLFEGHTLVVPRAHHVALPDLPAELLAPLFAAVQAVAGAVGALGATGSFVAMNNRVSQSVAHLHVHVVPRRPRDGLRGFFWPRISYASDAHAAHVAAQLRAALTDPRV